MATQAIKKPQGLRLTKELAEQILANTPNRGLPPPNPPLTDNHQTAMARFMKQFCKEVAEFVAELLAPMRENALAIEFHMRARPCQTPESFISFIGRVNKYAGTTMFDFEMLVKCVSYRHEFDSYKQHLEAKGADISAIDTMEVGFVKQKYQERMKIDFGALTIQKMLDSGKFSYGTESLQKIMEMRARK